jgi:hypothetical protein
MTRSASRSNGVSGPALIKGAHYPDYPGLDKPGNRFCGWVRREGALAPVRMRRPLRTHSRCTRHYRSRVVNWRANRRRACGCATKAYADCTRSATAVPGNPRGTRLAFPPHVAPCSECINDVVRGSVRGGSILQRQHCHRYCTGHCFSGFTGLKLLLGVCESRVCVG